MDPITRDIIKYTLLGCITLTSLNMFDSINFHYLHKAGGDGATGAMAFQQKLILKIGLSNAYYYALLFPIAISMTQSISIASSQSYGAQKVQLSIMYFEVALLLQYGVAFILFIFVFIITNYTNILVYNEDVMVHFNKIILFVFGRVFFFFYFTLEALLNSFKLFALVCKTLVFTTTLHFCFTHLMVSVFQTGVNGVLFSILFNDLVNCGLFLYHITHNKVLPNGIIITVPKWKDLIEKEKIMTIFRFTKPLYFQVFSNYFAFNAITFIAGTYGTAQVVATLAIFNIDSLHYNFGLSLGCTVNTFIGINFGKGDKRTTMQILKTGKIFIIIVTYIFMTIFYTSQEYWMNWYTQSQEIQSIIREMIVFLTLFGMPIDCFQGYFIMNLKGIEQRDYAGKISIIFFLFIAIPLMYFIGTILQFKLFGLWIGITIVNGILSTLAILKIDQLDLDSIIKQVKNRLQKEESLVKELELIKQPQKQQGKKNQKNKIKSMLNEA